MRARSSLSKQQREQLVELFEQGNELDLVVQLAPAKSTSGYGLKITSVFPARGERVRGIDEDGNIREVTFNYGYRFVVPEDREGV